MKPSLFDPSPIAAILGVVLAVFAPPPYWSAIGVGIVIVEGLLLGLWTIRNRSKEQA